MLILLEGPDGGGKTATARSSAFADCVYKHNGPPIGTTQIERVEWQLAGLKPVPGAKHTVVDRSWPSEQIYHKFADRPDVFSAPIHQLFDEFMSWHAGVIVICLPPYEVARRTWRERADQGKELLTKEMQFREMYDFYKNYGEWWPTYTPVVYYDFTTTTPEQLRENINELVAEQYDL